MGRDSVQSLYDSSTQRSFLSSLSPFSTPSLSYSVIANGCMVAQKQKQADRLLSCMAGCITGNTGEHLHPGSPSKTRICNVASRKTHLCTHTQAQTDTAVWQMLVRTWSFYWHVYISHNTLKAHAYTHTHKYH